MKYVFATYGHRYGEFDCVTSLQGGPFPFTDFPPHPDLTARYAKDARTPQQIIRYIEAQGSIVADALARLNVLMSVAEMPQ